MTRKTLLIRDVTLRDGQQSLFATRMTGEQVNRVLPFYKDAHFYAMEVWGGAVPDSMMRYLGENPWERLDDIREAVGGVSRLTALSRGRNLFGYNPYPEEVIRGFCSQAVGAGIGIMRVFDALNDMENVRSTIRFVREAGGVADGAISYTVDPRFSARQKLSSLVHFKSLPRHLFTADYFAGKALEMKAMGADIITIKDMAGLITPSVAAMLVTRIKQETGLPVDFHTHCTPGFGLASTLMAIIHGTDIVDTALLPFSGGPAAPSFEIIQVFCDRLGIGTGVDLKAASAISRELRNIRAELADYDSCKCLPIEFDISGYKLPREVNRLFTKAIVMARKNRENELIGTCHEIEAYFGLPEPDHLVREAEIPGGMYTNMLAQLKQLGLDQHLPRVLELVPMVRLRSGCPPLVTPTSQIIGVQAVNCVIDESREEPWFTTRSSQYVNLVKGVYGKTPFPVDPAFRRELTGSPDEIPYDTSQYAPQDNPELEEFGGVKLAGNERDLLLLELFPNVAREFLQRQTEEAYQARIFQIEEENRRKQREAREAYERLSPEEKKERLLGGLYSWQGLSYPEEESA